MPLVVVRHCPGPAPLQRQTGLGATQCLDLALLVYSRRKAVGPGRVLQLGRAS